MHPVLGEYGIGDIKFVAAFDVDQNKVFKIKIDENNVSKSLRVLSGFFKKDVKDLEVALNLYSGSGVEHMITLSSILKAGLGVRFVHLENNEVKELEILDEDYSAINEEL